MNVQIKKTSINQEYNNRGDILFNEETEEVFDNTSIVGLISAINDRPKKRYIIEPAVLLIFLAGTVFDSIVVNTVEKHYCLNKFNLTFDECMDKSNPHRSTVQQLATRFNLIRTCIETSIPALMTFFVGPWSDTFGRKPLMLSSSIGLIITYSLWTWASTVPSLNPMYFIAFSFPLAFCGGSTLLILASFCYICDITTLETRAVRLGLIQAFLFLGNLIGTLLILILPKFGYTVIFAVATSFAYISLIYIYVFVEESIIPSQIQRNSVNKNPFHIDHVKGLFATCYSKQPPRIRLILSLLIIVLTCSLINIFGELGVAYLFLQNVLGWDVSSLAYITMNSASIIVNSIVAFGGAWLCLKVLKLNDLLVLSVAAFFRILSELVMIFGYRVWHIYLSRFLASTVGFTGPLIRSYLSTIIPHDELGKIFSLLSSGESVTPLFASLMYSTLYSSTLETFPQAIFCLSAFILLIMLILLVIVVKLHFNDSSIISRKNRSLQNMDNANV